MTDKPYWFTTKMDDALAVAQDDAANNPATFPAEGRIALAKAVVENMPKVEYTDSLRAMAESYASNHPTTKQCISAAVEAVLDNIVAPLNDQVNAKEWEDAIAATFQVLEDAPIQAKVTDVLLRMDITGPDGDGLVWLPLRPTTTSLEVMCSLGNASGFAGKAGIAFEQERQEALSAAPPDSRDAQIAELEADKTKPPGHGDCGKCWYAGVVIGAKPCGVCTHSPSSGHQFGSIIATKDRWTPKS